MNAGPIPSLSSPMISTTANRHTHLVKSCLAGPLPSSSQASSSPSAHSTHRSSRGSGVGGGAASILPRSRCIMLPTGTTTNSTASSESSGPQPTTVSPLSSLFTSLQPQIAQHQQKRLKNDKTTVDDDEENVWLFDPDRTTNSARSTTTSGISELVMINNQNLETEIFSG